MGVRGSALLQPLVEEKKKQDNNTRRTPPPMLSMMRLTSTRISASDASLFVTPSQTISVEAIEPGAKPVSSYCGVALKAAQAQRLCETLAGQN